APLLFKVFEQLPHTAEISTPAAPADDAAPPALARLSAEAGAPPDRPSPQMPLRLEFPPNHAVLDLDRDDGGIVPISLQAAGGRRPLVWFVNDRPVTGGATRRDASWTPDGEGFARITVIDADGKSATSVVRLRAAESDVAISEQP